MRLLEHQSKTLLKDFEITFADPTVVDSSEAASQAVELLGGPAVLKAQVPFGGRGKSGAIKFVDTPEQGRVTAIFCAT